MTRRTEEHFEKVYQAKSPDEHRQIYGDWAETYEDAMKESGYVSPPILAETRKNVLGGTDPAILDVGCGTGRGGMALRKAGFQVIDGIDLTEEMMKVARSKGLYRTLQTADLLQTIPIQDGTYQGAYSTGVFTKGHVGPDRVPEVMRVRKPGGIFCLTVAQNAWADQGWHGALVGLESSYAVECIGDTLGEHVTGHTLQAHFLTLRKPVSSA